MIKFKMSSLKTKISVVVVGFIVIILGFSGGYSYWSYYKISMENDRGKAESIAKLLGGIATYTFSTYNYTTLDEAIDKALEQEEVLQITIFDKDGSTKREKRSGKQDQKHITVKIPIVSGQGTSGYISLVFSTQKTHDMLLRLIRAYIIQIIMGMVVSSALLIFLLNKLVIRPIDILNNTAKEISEGNLVHTMTIKGDDEIASLSRAINAMASNLKDMIFKIRSITNTISSVSSTIASSSHKVLNGADTQKKAVVETAVAIEDLNDSISNIVTNTEGLSALAGDTESSITQINGSIEMIAENSGIFYEASQETASSVEEMSASIKQIAENLENLSASSEETASAVTEMSASVKEVGMSVNESVALAEKVNTDASKNGLTAINAAMEGIIEIKDTVNALADVISRLRKRSDDIGKILTVIDDVTDQTALLAINAAILSSKAGEHGKGFSVVANEIKDLAERTSASTADITNLIASVQEETKSSFEMTAKGIQSVEKGTVLVNNVKAALNSIIENSVKSAEMAKVIQRATSQEINAINQITAAVHSMTDQISQISLATQEQNTGSKFIIQAAEKMKDISLQVKTTTSEQAQESKQISGAIEDIASQISMIVTATQSQRGRSEDIVSAVDKIHLTADELMKSSAEMDTEISTLTNEAENLMLALEKFKT